MLPEFKLYALLVTHSIPISGKDMGAECAGARQPGCILLQPFCKSPGARLHQAIFLKGRQLFFPWLNCGLCSQFDSPVLQVVSIIQYEFIIREQNAAVNRIIRIYNHITSVRIFRNQSRNTNTPFKFPPLTCVISICPFFTEPYHPE